MFTRSLQHDVLAMFMIYEFILIPWPTVPREPTHPNSGVVVFAGSVSCHRRGRTSINLHDAKTVRKRNGRNVSAEQV